MSNLSELLPAGAGAKSATFVASGTLASGVTVALKSNGQVEAVAGVAGGGGTPTVFGASIALSSVPSIVYDTLNDKVVISYAENTSCYSVVGTVSGTSISFGTPVSFGANAFDGANAGISSAFDSNSNKVVVTFKDSSNSNYVTIRVGTVSGTSISFGSALHEYIPIDDDTATVFDSTNNKIVVFFRNTSTSTGGCQVGTVSGTSISLGAQQTFVAATAYPQYMSAVFDSDSGKTVTVYRAVSSNNNYGTAFVGTVSGTSISFGTSVVYESSDSTYNTLAYDSTTGKVVIGFRANTYGNAIVGTVSGTSISFGAKNVWHSADTNEISLAYNIPKSKIVLSYRDSSNGYYISSIDGTVSGTSISFGPAFDISGSKGNKTFSVYDPDSAKVVVGYGNQDNSYIGTAVVVTTPSSNSTDFVGITDEAISSAASGSVVVQGGVATKASATLPAVLSAGTAAVFEAATTSKVSATFDSNSNKVVIAYQDEGNSNYGTAVIGTVSGTTISYGTPVVFDAGTTSYMGITFDSNSNKAVIAYTDGSNIKAIVGTVSGTSISFGTAVQFNTGATNNPISLSFDSTANKVVISYNNQGNSSFGTSIVGTVSGTSISFGTAAVFISAGSGETGSAYDSTNNKTAIAFINAAGHLAAIVATLSGTSLTFGSVATNSLASATPCAVFDPVNNKIVIAYKQSVGTASVCTISGTSISLGTPVVFNNNNTGSISGAYNVDKSNIVFVSYQFGATGIAIVGTVSGTSISFGTAATFESGEIAFTSSVYDSVAKKTLAAYQDTPNSYYGTATVFTQSAGVLTIASDYYVQTDGTISTTSSTVPAGRALSTTSMLLEG